MPDLRAAVSRHELSYRMLPYRPAALGISAIVVAALISGCNSEQLMCPQWLVSPIIVEVRDAATGLPAAQGAMGTIRSGTYVGTLLPATSTEPLELHAPGGPGMYDVTVQKTGYRDWTRNDVRVTGGRCGVEKSVVLRANLERTS